MTSDQYNPFEVARKQKRNLWLLAIVSILGLVFVILAIYPIRKDIEVTSVFCGIWIVMVVAIWLGVLHAYRKARKDAEVYVQQLQHPKKRLPRYLESQGVVLEDRTVPKIQTNDPLDASLGEIEQETWPSSPEQKPRKATVTRIH